MSLSINWGTICSRQEQPRQKPNKALAKGSAAGSSADLHHASRRGLPSLTTGSDFRCHPRGNSESEVRPLGIVLPLAAVHPTGSAQASLAKASQASVWLVGTTRVDGARSGGYFAG